MVDESMMTGESLPVLKSVGDSIVGATKNGDGMLKCPSNKSRSRYILKCHCQTHRRSSRAQKHLFNVLPIRFQVSLYRLLWA